MDSAETPHSPIDPTDVLALVAMALFSMRRLSVRVASREQFPHVPAAAFEQWKQMAFRAYSLGIRASFLKFAVNTLWYYGARGLGPGHAAGGALIFVAWVVALMIAWYRISESKKRQEQLGIVLSGRAPDEGDSPQR